MSSGSIIIIATLTNMYCSNCSFEHIVIAIVARKNQMLLSCLLFCCWKCLLRSYFTGKDFTIRKSKANTL